MHNSHANRTQQKQSKAVANIISRKQFANNSHLQFLNNRPEAIAQRKLQGMANNYLYNQNLPIQLKTSIKNIAQQYTFFKENVLVGKTMEAWLDPKDMKTGQSASVNSSQNKLMTKIRKSWKITGGDVVKGHLLNDHLGGTALNNNLYPITRAANKDHLMYVENAVKRATSEDGWPGVYYKVEVDGNPNIKEAKATYKTTISQWNPTTNKKGGTENVNVPSNLKDVAAYHEAYNPDDSSMELETIANPENDFEEPSTRVKELSDREKEMRKVQPVSSEYNGGNEKHTDEDGTTYTY